MFKNRGQEDEKYKIKAFAPDEKLDNEYSKLYFSYIDEFMDNSLVKNIALTGDFGIGKSTLIRNYEEHKQKKFISKKRYAYLSVTDLNLPNASKNINDIKDIQEKIELRILKQLLVICKKHDIEGSHYRPVPERKSFFIPILITLAAIMIAVIKLGLINNVKNNSLYLVLLICLCGILLFYIVTSAFRHYKLPSFEFKFGNSKNNTTVQTETGDDGETLDKNLTDIVYLMETVYKKTGGVIVIEDIDRYDTRICIPVLEKLREINILVNQRMRFNNKGEKTFKFIYILKDDIFSENLEDELSVPATKFFDGVIPVLPKIGHTNSEDYLLKNWEKYNLDTAFINEIAPYIYDYRQIRAIENEFNIFLNISNEIVEDEESIKNTEIMALSIYKFFYPDAYYQIRKNTYNELIKYLVDKKLYEITKDFLNKNLYAKEYNIPKLPKEKIKAILFEFLSLDVLKYLFENSTISKVMDYLDELDNYIKQPKALIDAKEVRDITKKVDELLVDGGLYSDDFRLIALYYENQYCGIEKTGKGILSSFEDALKNKNIIAHYQPIFSINGDEIVGAEALARWVHNSDIIMPMNYLQVTNQNGLTYKLDKAIIDVVINNIKRNHYSALEKSRISINISSFEGKETISEICMYLLKVMKENEIKPSTIIVEFCEPKDDTAYNHIQQSVKMLKLRGVDSWLDDFGIGNLSLGILKDCPFSGVKVDRSLFNNSEDEKKKKILEQMFNLFKQMNMKIIAEGVETIKEVELLKSIGCDYIQGFYYSKPLPIDEYNSIYRNKENNHLTTEASIIK